jgi:hypothetical protein
VLGLALRVCSAELAADLDDSDCRCFAGACSTGSQLMVPIGGICGRGGSSRTARDDRLRSSVKERLIERRAGGWVEESSSRRNSWERRILAPRLIRDVFFFGPVNSPVGAVVMISGARLPVSPRAMRMSRGYWAVYAEGQAEASRPAASPSPTIASRRHCEILRGRSGAVCCCFRQRPAGL